MTLPSLSRAGSALLAVAALAAAALLALALPGGAPALAADKGKRDLKAEEKLRKDTRRVSHKHAGDLEPIIRWCVEKKLLKEAAENVETIERIAPDYKKLPELRELVKTTEAAAGAPAEADLKEYTRKINYARDSYASQLFKLAKDCARSGMFTRAYDLIGDVLDADPDHAQARKLRGYVRVQGKWETKYAAKMLKDHVLYKDKNGVVQGWVPKKDVKKWDEGLRPFGGGWLPEEEEIRKCQMNEYRTWRVETEHFEVRTNVSRNAAWEFGLLLEDFYDQFFRTFLGFFDLEKGVELLFDTKPLKKRHVVLYLPSRNHYLQHVKAEHGNDELLLRSAGFYGPCKSQGANTSHFFRHDDMESVIETFYHETTHQLFAETKDDRGGGSEGNNWVSEGIATYVETWGKDARGKWIPGMKKTHKQLVEAREFLANNKGWSLSDFLAIDNEAFHKDQVQRHYNYCVAGALSHFLMHYDDERYKEDFVKFIAVYYDGKAKANSLYDHLQIEGPESKRAETLERQFLDYMARLGEPEKEGDGEGEAGDE